MVVTHANRRNGFQLVAYLVDVDWAQRVDTWIVPARSAFRRTGADEAAVLPSVGNVTSQQRLMCDRFGVEPVPVRPEDTVGIALNVREGARPIKAIRHPPVGHTTGWYIWGGEVEASTQGDDFFAPLHVSHVSEWAAEIIPYLALPPGYGVIVESGYEDVWFDAAYADE